MKISLFRLACLDLIRSHRMNAQFVRIVFLIWLGWYLTGPVVETFDFWDTPQEEMADVASSIDGALVWAAAAICLAILVSRELCRCCSYLTEAGLLELSLIWVPLVDPSATEPGSVLTGSTPLRI